MPARLVRLARSEEPDAVFDPAGSWSATRDVVETFEDLYAREYDGLVRLAFLLVDTREEAEEVVQEAFVHLFDRWDRVRDRRAYVRRSVVNRSRDLLRRRRTRRRNPPTAAVPVEQQHDSLLDAVRRLSPRARAVVVLRFYDDRTIDQIAELLELRPGTVKSLLHRALDQLRTEVESWT